jgi:hypothetical protein
MHLSRAASSPRSPYLCFLFTFLSFLCQEGGETHQDLSPTLLASSIKNYSQGRWDPWIRGSCTVCLSRRGRHLTLPCSSLQGSSLLSYLQKMSGCCLQFALPSDFKTNCQLYEDFPSRHAFCSGLIGLDLLCLSLVTLRLRSLLDTLIPCLLFISAQGKQMSSVCSAGRIISDMEVKGTW